MIHFLLYEIQYIIYSERDWNIFHMLKFNQYKEIHLPLHVVSIDINNNFTCFSFSCSNVTLVSSSALFSSQDPLSKIV